LVTGACTDVWSIIKIDALQHLTPAKAEFGGYGGIPGFEELAEGEGTERRTEVTRRDTGTRDRGDGTAGRERWPCLHPCPIAAQMMAIGRRGEGEVVRGGDSESALCPGSDEELCSLPLSKSGGAKGALERRDGQ